MPHKTKLRLSQAQPSQPTTHHNSLSHRNNLSTNNVTSYAIPCHLHSAPQAQRHSKICCCTNDLLNRFTCHNRAYTIHRITYNFFSSGSHKGSAALKLITLWNGSICFHSRSTSRSSRTSI